MPSTYMSPWRKGYLGDLFGAMGKAIAYTTTYDEMETLVYLYSEPDENGGIPLFERITGDKAVWYESDLVEMAGWYVSYEGMEGVTLQAEMEPFSERRSLQRARMWLPIWPSRGSMRPAVKNAGSR